MFAPESETEIHRKIRVLKGREHIHSMVLKLMVLLCEINEHVQIKPFESYLALLYFIFIITCLLPGLPIEENIFKNLQKFSFTSFHFY